MKKFLIPSLFFFILSHLQLSAQIVIPNNFIGNTPFQNTVALYYDSIGINAHLFIGSEYTFPDPIIKGFPFLDTNVLRKGNIYFNGVLYQDVPMLYDIQTDNIITTRYHQYFFIRLPSEKVSYFFLGGYLFIRLVPDSSDKVLPSIGFYKVLYNGKSTVLLKSSKSISNDPPIDDKVNINFVIWRSYFIKKGNEYFRVLNQKSLLKLLGDNDKVIRRFLRKNKLKFKKKPDETIAKAAAYYDQITN